MREVKFRAKVIHHPFALNNDKKAGEWVVGELHLKTKIPHIHVDMGKKYPVDVDSIGQYVGRKDVNERDMYEGDIFTVNGKYPKIIMYSEEDMAFILYNLEDYLIPNPRERICHKQTPDQTWWNDFNREIEVIGNIHDNPELLKEETK